MAAKHFATYVLVPVFTLGVLIHQSDKPDLEPEGPPTQVEQTKAPQHVSASASAAIKQTLQSLPR